MNVLLGKVLGRWLVTKEDCIIESVDQAVPVIHKGRELRKFKLMIPTEVLYLLWQRLNTYHSPVRFEILIDKHRAYMVVYIEGDPEKQIPLFYWIKSNAPVWLKKHMPRV